MKTSNHHTTMHISYRSPKFIVVVSASALFLAVLLLAPSPAPTKPVIAWSPDSVNQTILAGESTTLSVSFTASENLNDVNVHVVPELEPYVQVAPTSFNNLTAGQAVNLDITIFAPANVPPGTFDGTILLRSGDDPKNTYAKPMSVELIISAIVGDQTIEKKIAYATIPITSSNDLGKIRHTGITILTQEPSYVVIKGTLGELKAVESLGFELREPIESDYKRRWIRVWVDSQASANYVRHAITDAFPATEFPGYIYGQAYDNEIQQLQKQGFQINIQENP